MPAREWGMAKAQFAILFEDRFRIAQEQCSTHGPHTKFLTVPLSTAGRAEQCVLNAYYRIDS